MQSSSTVSTKCGQIALTGLKNTPDDGENES